MAKKVPVFVYVDGQKTGRGHLEFFENETFEKFLTEGGNLTIRCYEVGDVSLVVKNAKD